MADQDRVTDSMFPRVFGAFGEDRLRQHIAKRELLHLRAPLGDTLCTLLTIADLEALVDGGEFPAEHIRIYARRAPVDPARINLVEDGKVLPGALASFAGKRATFVFNQLEDALPQLVPFARDAERLLRDPVHIGAVLSFAEETGIDRHYDHQNILILQLEGTKTWNFYGDPVDGSARRCKRSEMPVDCAPRLRIAMEPGDLLLVPSGQVHDCEPAAQSLHLGVLIRHLSGIAIAQALLKRVEADDWFATPMPGLAGEHASAQAHRACRDAIAALLESLDLEALHTRR